MREHLAGVLHVRHVLELEGDVVDLDLSPLMKFTVWWSGLQRMNTNQSSIQSETLKPITLA